MTLRDTEITEAADRLIKAETSRTQIGLLSLQYPTMTLEDAYAIQAAQQQRRLASGHKVIGWKIGLTSRVMQEALGIDTPDSGVLYDDMLYPDGGVVPQGRFIQPRIEAEIAFVLNAPLQGEVTRAQVLQATDYVAPALEILDTRILRRDPQTGAIRKIVDTVADNAANAGLVLGPQKNDPGAFDLGWTGAIVRKNSEIIATGLGAAVLGDPVMALVWLARRMHRNGQIIGAGQIVLSGSFIAPIECPNGSEIAADFGPFGAVSIRFA